MRDAGGRRPPARRVAARLRHHPVAKGRLTGSFGTTLEQQDAKRCIYNLPPANSQNPVVVPILVGDKN